MNSIYIVGTVHIQCQGHGEYWPVFTPSFEHGFFPTKSEAEEWISKQPPEYKYQIEEIKPNSGFQVEVKPKTFHKIYK